MKAAMFDMDGTLLHTEHVAIPAFNATFEEMKKQGLYNGPTPPGEMLLAQLGKTLDKIWEALLPDTSVEVHLQADKIMLAKEIELISQGKSVFYPQVLETLTELKKRGYAIFVVSNGLEEYIDAIVHYSGFSNLFTDLYSAGRFNTKTKTELLAKLLADYPNITEPYMIGDRHSDIEAGKGNNIPTIGCLFGYGDMDELKDSDYFAKSFPEIAKILP